MALPIHYRRVHGPATSDNIDDNFEVLATAVEELQASRDDGVQIDTITLDDTGGALIITLTDARQFGPFPIGGSIRPMGDHLEGIEYRRGDIVALLGSSYLCMIPHLAGELAADLALGRWMTLAEKGAGGSGEGGGDGSGNIVLSGFWPHQLKDIAAAEGGPSETRIGFAIPKDCKLAAVTARLIYAPGVGKTVDVHFSRHPADGDGANANFKVRFTGTSPLGVVVQSVGEDGLPGIPEYAAGDMVMAGISAMSEGHSARDLAVTLEFEPL